ncbi:hypothetical protein [Nonlabens xiamenensis]|uniref:hypothetical protein n=1 Tax=Nonlabens xiamenensis TaxID=2341043 RepID=UPI000F609721|nr:hypothetical protein [Nonlabens xiamenensis]
MACYILSTKRSFPNPIEGEDYIKPFYDEDNDENYTIEYVDEGPGTMPLGKDIVHYIGEEQKLCVGNCTGGRNPIYRFYRGSKDDHKYSKTPELTKEHAVGDDESWQKVLRGYNPEPRQGQIPVFYLMSTQVGNSVPVYVWYRGERDDNTKLTTSNSQPSSNNGKPYYLVGTLGYIFTSLSDAQAEAGTGETPVPLYHYFYDPEDDFYTIDPANEVNLKGGPIPPADPRDERYVYQGIFGYVFTGDNPDAPESEYKDVGKIGPTGQCVDKSGWYTWGNEGSGFSYRDYRKNSFGTNAFGQPIGTPGVSGFGESGTAGIVGGVQADGDANFEWLYGLNGAVKGSVPRFLGFQTAYDSQYMYYLYDTSYPWNGPVFGIQYELSDATCCPNHLDDDDVDGCILSKEWYSHFYQIREDSWKTTKTRIEVTGPAGSGVEESFRTADTDTHRIFFKYLTTTGTFRKGEQINGWNIAGVFYFGGKMNAGYMELTKDGRNKGEKFTYLQQFVSHPYPSDEGDPPIPQATIQVLAGYGIEDKAAFFGVYEFEKNIAYYKVKVDPKALIPTRTLDLAEAEAVVDTEGKIIAIDIINGGVGYKNPIVTISEPGQLEEFSSTDTARQMRGAFLRDYDKPVKKFPDYNQSGEIGEQKISLDKFERRQLQVLKNRKEREFDTVQQFRNAEVRVGRITKSGIIKRIDVVEGGSGYDPQNPPMVYIAEKGISINVDTKFSEQSLDDAQNDLADMLDFEAEGNPNASSKITESMSTINAGYTTNVPITYMEYAEVDPEGKTVLCQNLPADCIEINMGLPLVKALPPVDFFENLNAQEDPRFLKAEGERSQPAGANFASGAYSQILSDLQQTEADSEAFNGLYGSFDGSRCIIVDQPIIHNIKKWFQMPCAYMEAEDNPRENFYGEVQDKLTASRKAFGYLPWKYCAPTDERAEFTVSLSFDGKTTGPQGQAFMEWLNSLPKPKLTPKRNVSGGYKTWKCTRGNVPGRCYRGSNNSIEYVPIGLEENTYDYNRSNYSRAEQFRLWLGNNLDANPVDTVATWNTIVNGVDEEGNATQTSIPGSQSYVAFTVNGGNCATDPTNIPHDCWDRYVRKGNNTNGVLDVYCGWDDSGNPLAGQTYYEITPPSATNTGANGGGLSPSWPGSGSGLCHSCNALEHVADCSISIDPKRMETSRWRIKMGDYSGTMEILNYLTGGTNALARSIKNLGNPFFDECQDKYPYLDGRQLRGEG